MSDFRFQPWPETIAITTLLEFCSWLEIDKRGGERMGKYTDDEIRTIPTVTIKAAADYDCEALL